jgi:hypothetical protein
LWSLKTASRREIDRWNSCWPLSTSLVQDTGQPMVAGDRDAGRDHRHRPPAPHYELQPSLHVQRPHLFRCDTGAAGGARARYRGTGRDQCAAQRGRCALSHRSEALPVYCRSEGRARAGLTSVSVRRSIFQSDLLSATGLSIRGPTDFQPKLRRRRRSGSGHSGTGSNGSKPGRSALRLCQACSISTTRRFSRASWR